MDERFNLIFKAFGATAGFLNKFSEMARNRLHFHCIKSQVMHELLRLLPFVVSEEDRTLILLTVCYENHILGARVPVPRVTLDSFTEEEFVDIFRFEKEGFGTV